MGDAKGSTFWPLDGPSRILVGLEKRQVLLNADKVEKYLQAINAWQARGCHMLQDTQQLFGKLLHTCSVLPAGRAYLTGLERMLKTGADKPFLPHRPDKAVRKDLEWWVSALQRGRAVRRLYQPSNFTDIQAFSDASSEVGIGIVIGNHWRAWKLASDWRTRNGKRDISWAEAVGFELLVYSIATLPLSHSCFIIFGDNTGVVEGWHNGRHRNREANECFKRINEFVSSLPRRFEIHSKYIQSK